MPDQVSNQNPLIHLPSVLPPSQKQQEDKLKATINQDNKFKLSYKVDGMKVIAAISYYE